MNETKLNHYYQVHVNHLLSTRLDTDLSKDFFEKVVFHGTAYNALLTISESFSQTGQSTFTLTGSYGTGKSTLGAILAGLVSSDTVIRKAAHKTISDKKLQKKIDTVFKYSDDRPWVVVKAVAGVSSPVELFHQSILQALQDAGLIDTLKDDLFLLSEIIHNEAQLVEWMHTIFRVLDGKISGMLFILDEMGKLLDKIVRSSGDLHLFQDLAETINRLSRQDCPFLFIGILHQAFADYAKGLSHQIVIEWSKIQGRFIDIPYRISLDESIALISKTIKRTNNKLPDAIQNMNGCIIQGVQSTINSRLIESSPKVEQYFKEALPLHPLTTVLLGTLSKSSFSQNERSIFSFLLSIEPFSFRRFLKENEDCTETYTIVDLWDFLSYNLQHQILSSKEGHVWSVAEQTLTLLSQKLNSGEVIIQSEDFNIYANIVKSIAMMNLFGKSLGVYSTPELINFSLPIKNRKKDLIDRAINNLVQWGIITYWHRSNSYEVVETSDLNLQQLLEEKLQTLSKQQNYLEHIPYSSANVLAKRYYQEKGVMRWMGQHLVNDIADLKHLLTSTKITHSKAFAHFVLITDKALNLRKIQNLSKDYSNFALAQLNNLDEISTWSREIFALTQIIKEQPKLMMDSIAKKEYEQRISYAYQQLDLLFQQSFNHVDWYYKGIKYSENSLSTISSNIADHVFNMCPAVFNELVVRNDISSAAAAGRKKLLEMMLGYEDQENLGISKFPPEKAIYLSCIKELGLHQYQEQNKIWQFVIPTLDSKDESESKNRTNIISLFERGLDFLKSKKELVSLDELYHIWSIPPFGLPKGILPIWSFALLLAKKDALAFYDKDVTQEFRFISEIDDEFLNKLIKRPNEVAVKFIRDQAEKNHFVKILADFINKTYDKNIESTPLHVARFIVSHIVKQSNWVKFSKDLTYFDQFNQQLRTIIVKADDPYKLLFEDIYELLDVDNESDLQIKSKIADFFIMIDGAKPSLLRNFKTKLQEELGGFEIEFIEQAKVISKSAADWQLQKFALHITHSSEKSQQWIINLITLLSQMPERDWTDDSIKKAFEMIPSYVQRFKQLCYFVKNGHPELADTQEQKHLAVIINTSNGFEEYNRDVTISTKVQKKIVEVTDSFRAYVDNLNELNKDAKALVLYELLKEYLNPVLSEENNKHVS